MARTKQTARKSVGTARSARRKRIATNVARKSVPIMVQNTAVRKSTPWTNTKAIPKKKRRSRKFGGSTGDDGRY